MLAYCRTFVAIAAVIAAALPRITAAADPAVEARVNSLVSQLTLDEKLSLLSGDTDGFSTCAIPRLKLPKLVMADGPQGVRNYGPACQFPAGVALAATWDISLAQAYGRALGLEARARGVHIMLGPGVNICRLPVNGRNFEYFGEDPYLASQVAAHWIGGMQNEGVAATIKHYAGNNQETQRHEVDVEMDARTLHEIYLPTFRRAVEQSHVWAVMSAYNRFGGVYCAGSNFLQNQVLKGELKFPGLVMSDWGACYLTSDLANGLDLEMPHAVHLAPAAVKEALDKHELDPARVDDAVRRLLRLATSMGFLDREQKRADLPADSPDSRQAALAIARSSIVLLKNEGAALPLDRKSIHRIAVYGPNADRTPSGGGGSGDVHPFHTVSFLQGIRQAAGSSVEVTAVPEVALPPGAAGVFPMVHTTPDGPAGFNVKSAGAHGPLPAQPGMNLVWKSGELPLGVKENRAIYVFSGVLVPDEDGDWEVATSAHLDAELDGKPHPLFTGDIIHVQKGKPLPISIRTVFLDRNHGGQVFATLRKPELPDLAAARGADAVIVCAGMNSAWDREKIDRPFDLPATQRRLIAALAAVNKRVIVTNNSGAGVGMAEWIGQVPAVLQTWYLGQEGGTALGEVLFGDVNPSGRLPDTFDRVFEDNPAYPNYPGSPEPGNPWPVEHYKEGIFVGYRGYDHAGKAPLFPFGYGLSYTSFAYKNVRLSQPTLAPDGELKVSVDVTNTGRVAGAEIVQLYVHDPAPVVEKAPRELKGFAKVSLQPGETQTVTLPLQPRDFAFFDAGGKQWKATAGKYELNLGASSRDLRLQAAVDLTGTYTEPASAPLETHP